MNNLFSNNMMKCIKNIIHLRYDFNKEDIDTINIYYPVKDLDNHIYFRKQTLNYKQIKVTKLKISCILQ